VNSEWMDLIWASSPSIHFSTFWFHSQLGPRCQSSVLYHSCWPTDLLATSYVGSHANLDHQLQYHYIVMALAF
jgi:hypothetical protein